MHEAGSLGKPDYCADQVRRQKRAGYGAGYDGWVPWHLGSTYAPFLAALERGPLVLHKRMLGASH